MKPYLKPLVTLSLATLTLPCLAFAEGNVLAFSKADNSHSQREYSCCKQVWISLGGLSKHSNGNYQEVNQGLGYSIAIDDKTRLDVGGYRNSLNRSSNYVLGNTDIGSIKAGDIRLKAGVQYGVVSGYRYGYIPMASPTMTAEFKSVGMMLTYIPEVSKINHSSVIAVQFRFRIGSI